MRCDFALENLLFVWHFESQENWKWGGMAVKCCQCANWQHSQFAGSYVQRLEQGWLCEHPSWRAAIERDLSQSLSAQRAAKWSQSSQRASSSWRENSTPRVCRSHGARDDWQNRWNKSHQKDLWRASSRYDSANCLFDDPRLVLCRRLSFRPNFQILESLSDNRKAGWSLSGTFYTHYNPCGVSDKFIVCWNFAKL